MDRENKTQLGLSSSAYIFIFKENCEDLIADDQISEREKKIFIELISLDNHMIFPTKFSSFLYFDAMVNQLRNY